MKYAHPFVSTAVMTLVYPLAKIAARFHERIVEAAWCVPLRRRPDFTIGTYMDRYWIIPRNRWFNVYLHFIWESDDDRAMHDHPSDSVSLILRGGYTEETPDGVFQRKPGDVVRRRAADLHRLAVNPTHVPTVSLFIMGPITRLWGFQHGENWVPFRDWDAYCAAHGLAQRTQIGGGSDAVSPRKLYQS